MEYYGENYRPGDLVSCKILERSIVPKTNDEYDSLVEFKIIGVKITPYDSTEFILYVTDDDAWKISNCERIGVRTMNQYLIDDKFEKSYITYAKSEHIFRIVNREDGMFCKNCEEFYDKAEPNQEDDSLICYLCRFNPYR